MQRIWSWQEVYNVVQCRRWMNKPLIRRHVGRGRTVKQLLECCCNAAEILWVVTQLGALPQPIFEAACVEFYGSVPESYSPDRSTNQWPLWSVVLRHEFSTTDNDMWEQHNSNTAEAMRDYLWAQLEAGGY